MKKVEIVNQIIGIFSNNPSQTFNYKQIAHRLNLPKVHGRRRVVEALNQLVTAERLSEVGMGKYRLNNKRAVLTGTIEKNDQGHICLFPDDGSKAVIIPEKLLNRAMRGDTVKVVAHSGKGGVLQGEVIEIIKRRKTEFVGTLEVSDTYAFLVPDSRGLGSDIFIPRERLNGGLNNQKAIVEIVDWPVKAKNPIGQVKRILGFAGENDTEIHAILAEFGLPHDYPEDIAKLADKIEPGITEEEIAKREDFRGVSTFTIDPADAKDFDDAISIRKLGDDLIEVGVHIADVTHYVKPDTIIEEEGYSRATSVYLVDRVVPMLPERISNFICSLRPNEEKLAFSVIFDLDLNGQVKDFRIRRTVILSDRRFSYEEAQEILEGAEGDFKDELLLLNDIAKKLRKKRFDNGSINFERTEVKFNIDDKGKPLSVYFKEAKDSNKLIEEFMLLANKTVATYIGKTEAGSKAKTFVYRIHDEPNPDKFDLFKLMAKRFGYEIGSGAVKGRVATSINKILKEVHGKPEQYLIETVAVRSMSKAIYSTHNIGHYGLAFPFYSHFTSPIRRYPDMMVHRLLESYMNGGKSVNVEKYEEMCEHSSEREQLAANAERASIKYKQVEFMADKVGQVFEGIISGVTDWGIYVELSENKCEGLVPMRTMDDDFYIFDEENMQIRGRHHGKVFQLGAPIQVLVAKANLEKKQLDFELAES